MKYLFYFILSFLFACSEYSSHQSRAKELTEKKDYQKAIFEYQQHIESRLEVKNRPDWENPYIYYLDIGNIYLEQGEVSRALEYYKKAEDKEVNQGYVNERYLYVAKKYEEQGQLEKAIKHLEKYKDRDPDLFNLVMDRMAKDLVRASDE